MLKFFETGIRIYANKNVPACARCGGVHTGYYVNAVGFTYRRAKRALHHAEYIIPADVDIITHKHEDTTCFCGDCGYQWMQVLETRFLTRIELEEEKERRGIYEAEKHLNVYISTELEAKKEAEKNEAKENGRLKNILKKVKKIYF